MKKGQGLPWHIVEKTINKEINWLERSIPLYRNERYLSLEYRWFYRQIALLIVTGKVKATEFRAPVSHDLWGGLTPKKEQPRLSRHGGRWHRDMMNTLRTYFQKQEFEVIDEPFLAMGRADLGVYKAGRSDLFIEVGTVSIKKLWWNLQLSTEVIVLLVPDETRAIEFVCRKPDDDRLRGTIGQNFDIKGAVFS